MTTKWVHELPKANVVDKNEFLRTVVRDKSVVHAGFAGQNRWEHGEVPVWVHGELAKTARQLIGIDMDGQGVKEAREAGYEAYEVDCQDPGAVMGLGIRADLAVAGDLIEHLDSPGPFLNAMHHVADRLVITTPNAFSLINFVSALVNREVVNPDHISLYSWYTLTNLLQRHDWHVDDFKVHVYESGRSSVGERYSGGMRAAAKTVVATQRLLSRFRPLVAHGLITVCRSSR